jgi:hypothetical protein
MMNGHCECGRVRFEVDGEIDDFSHCHCSQCRRLHGAAYGTFAGVLRKDFRYVSGEDQVKTYASSEKYLRSFCSNCGSSILAAPEMEPDHYYVSMSMIEGNPPHPPAYHVYVGSKATWHEITDNLPQYDTLPDESD